MKRLLLLAAFALSASAHPGVGIVVDSKGNIFYTDLRQIWRLAPNGALGIAVPGVHSHELFIDANDNLYGENVHYNGEQLNTWTSRVWKRSPDGRVVDIVPAHAGFNDNWGFKGYVVRRRDQQPSSLYKCSPACRPFGSYRFNNIRFFTVAASGNLYFVDLTDIVKMMPDGRGTVIARDVNRNRDPHQVMGIWTDREENVYVADYGNRVVKRIDKRGNIDIVARSKFPWAPSGGTLAPNGDLLILETKIMVGDETRVVRVTPSSK